MFSDEKGRLDREEFDFRYTYLGISYIGANNADSGLAINTSFNLPGPLYLKFERRGDGIDFEKETVMFSLQDQLEEQIYLEVTMDS